MKYKTKIIQKLTKNEKVQFFRSFDPFEITYQKIKFKFGFSDPKNLLNDTPHEYFHKNT